MKQSTLETLIGVLVVGLAAAFLLFMFSSQGRQSGQGYDLLANFNNAEGVAVGSEVRMAGVKIGRIDEMRLNSQTFQAELVLNVHDEVLIPRDSEVNIASDGLLGGAYVEVVAGADEAVFADGDAFLYTNDAVSLINLFATFAAGGKEN